MHLQERAFLLYMHVWNMEKIQLVNVFLEILSIYTLFSKQK